MGKKSQATWKSISFCFTLTMIKTLVFGTLLVLAVYLCKEAEGKSPFLDDLCEKCESRKQDGCRFCRKNEAVGKCKERCRKGCKICGGKDREGLESCRS